MAEPPLILTEMCLYPRLIKNRKYKPNKKNKGNPPEMTDWRFKAIPVPCGKCMECKKQRANGWRVRLMEDIKQYKNGKFVTMTFSEEALKELEQAANEKRRKALEGTGELIPDLEGYDLENAMATVSVRRFNERYRKIHGKALRHWLVSELGQNNTERLHIHGIIWTDIPKKDLEQIWKYGNVNKRDINWERNYVSERTVNYIVKYVHKTDKKHEYYNPVVLTSPGIGAAYLNKINIPGHRFKDDKTKDYYKTREGFKVALPTYYKNKLFNEEQREKMWGMRLDKQERWVKGMRIDISQGEEEYLAYRDQIRILNKELGFGSDEVDKEKEKMERRIRNWLKVKRDEKLKLKANERKPKKDYFRGKHMD